MSYSAVGLTITTNNPKSFSLTQIRNLFILNVDISAVFDYSIRVIDATRTPRIVLKSFGLNFHPKY